MSEKYVAVKPVFMDRSLARVANPGDAIPASHPLRSEWVKAGLVERVEEKAERKHEGAPEK